MFPLKAKDIALLCTAAAGAGAAAGAAVSSRSKDKSKEKKNAVKASAGKKSAGNGRSKPAKVVPHSIDTPADAVSFFADTDIASAVAVTADGRNAYRADSSYAVSEMRCPSGITGAAYAEGCTMFITHKGGVFVYDYPEKESVFCGLTSPEYVCSFGGRFYVFSDCLLYICTNDGNIEKTVSLGAMIDIRVSDICDAESSDGSFSAAEVAVKKAIPLGKTELAAVLTEDGRTFIMSHDEEDFYSFEKTYEDIIDLCAFGDHAYYLCRMDKEYGIIKTAISSKSCETAGKYRLCGSEKTPVSIFSCSCGIGILYDDGQVKFLLPEIRSESRREKARSGLSALGTAFSDIHAERAFSFGEDTAVISNGKMTVYSVG